MSLAFGKGKKKEEIFVSLFGCKGNMVIVLTQFPFDTMLLDIEDFAQVGGWCLIE